MKINKLVIRDYKVLINLEFEFNKGLNIIYGPNGSGKSLVIEAIRKLFRKKKRREEGYPRGNIIIQENDTENSLSTQNSIEEIAQISEEQLDNIFLTKDGCLEIENGRNFYQKVITQLLNIDVQDIENIQYNLCNLGRMTGKLNLSDDKKFGKPGLQIKNANKLIADIKTFLISSEELISRSFDLEHLEILKQKNVLQERLTKIELARKIKRIQECEGYLQELKAHNVNYQEFIKPEFSELQDLYTSFIEKRHGSEFYEIEMVKWSRFGLIALLLPVVLTIVVFMFPEVGLAGLILPLASFIVPLYSFNQRRQYNLEHSFEKNQETKILSLAKKVKLNIENIHDIEFELKNYQNVLSSIERKITEYQVILQTNYPQAIVNGSFSLHTLETVLDTEKSQIDMTIPLKYADIDPNTLINQIKELDTKLNQLQNMKNSYIVQISDFAQRANSIRFEDFLGESLSFEISNFESLELLLGKLRELIDLIENDKQLSEIAYTIFDEIYAEEMKKVQSYLGEETEITTFVERITEHLFTGVTYSIDSDEFTLQRQGGLRQTLEELSRGELAQLYFAIRLALAKKCCQQGFLIMEDPFLSSDNERIDLQLNILLNFIQEGWQVILFTAKENLKQKLCSIGGTLTAELDRIIELSQ